MAIVNVGRVRPIWKGTWSSSTAYVKDDIVFHDNSSWIATASSTNSSPSIGNSDWDQMSVGTPDIPNQAGQAAKFLQTDGSGLSWATVDVAGGSNIESISSDKTLLATDDRHQILTPSATGLNVILPSTADLNAGDSFVINNKNSFFALTVKNSNSESILSLPANTTTRLIVASTSSQDWEETSTGNASPIGLGSYGVTSTSYNGSSTSYIQGGRIFKDSTNTYKYIFSKYSGWSHRYVKFTIDDSGVVAQQYTVQHDHNYPPENTYGDPHNLVHSMDSANRYFAVIGYSSNSPEVRVYDTSADGSTFNSVSSQTSTQLSESGILNKLDSTRYLVIGQKSDSTAVTSIYWNVWTYSSPTASASQGSYASYTPIGAATLGHTASDVVDTDKVVTGFEVHGSNSWQNATPYVIASSISGTSVSNGSPVQITADLMAYRSLRIHKVGTSKFLAFWVGADFKCYGVVGTVSGTSITLGTVTALSGPQSASGGWTISKEASENILFAIASDAASAKAIYTKITVDGTSVSATPIAFLGNNFVNPTEKACFASLYDSEKGANVVMLPSHPKVGFGVTSSNNI